MKILVVSDSLFCRKIVKAQLEEKIPGVEVLYAANGDEGWKISSRIQDNCRLDLLITLHDIGKNNITEEILTKKEALNQEESADRLI